MIPPLRTFALLVFLSISCIAWVLPPLWGGVIYGEELSVREVEVGNFLRWTTVQEIDNMRFRIQKSSDGFSFVTIAEVKGRGTADGEKEYRYLDPAIGEQQVWYRLAQEDRNGTLTYSHVVRVQRHLPNEMRITAMSSTRTGRFFSFTLLSKISTEAVLQMSDATGKLVWCSSQDIRPGEQVIVVDMEPFALGLYKMQLRTAHEVETVIIEKTSPEDTPHINVAVHH